MNYTKGEWKLPCGCSILLEPNSPPLLTYCPKHKSAPDLYEALKAIIDAENEEFEQLGYGRSQDARKALAEAEQK